MSLEKVCHDENGSMDWMYDAKEQKYVRFDEQHNISGVIAGQYLPDPELLWRNRCNVNDVLLSSEVGQKLKPQAATFKLWKHWQRISKNADTDNLLRPV